MVAGTLENTLTLWSDFCDAVTEALNDGKDLDDRAGDHVDDRG
jgi:hypothetical protein